ncbi:protein-tyrosine phosphatase-like protein [Annulohypoxylon truncatum]|uniref:protein-tyrosine phosphatase-like protein n=1 Tax=Annulohypoxylon truncatum TaxID=327061 RepID=UPI002007D8C4|nr:protein-tyrosine phosphatase-like protein [Annulohypoxylon truncatum]KAI1213614.1 protein-tyrosine phosphatase-like protein [Annulohypoxylon truncatum]
MKPRAETLPTALETGPGLIQPDQLKDMLTNVPENEFLLLDIRVSTHYARSRIRGALNLCIPTTLLKRATFNLEKLQQTLQTEEDQQKFAQWPNVKYLIVYDGHSSEKRDAVSAMNMFKKFSNEGFSGRPFLLRGGFDAFATEHPTFVDHQSASQRPGTSVSPEGGRPSFAPVIGGVMLPSNANNPNPFFSNIRQNMDLADGVGQMDISVPSSLDSSTLPHWLQDVTKSSDHGKKASERFLQIERREQSRMKEAYASFNTSATPGLHTGKVCLSGVEKGGKNRYKDILPFEHARVHLTGRPEGVCDYINASHVQASRSYKRYIASQGPLPATFDDFWSVIWDQDVRVIVMLTAESEGGQLKCHPYWQNREFGSIRLKPLSEKKVSLDIDKHRSTPGAASSTSNTSEYARRRANTTTTFESAQNVQPSQPQPETPYVIVRKFALSHSSHPFSPMREVTQLHYASWPDFGAPAQPSHLLALVELANVMQRAALPVNANSIAASVATENPAAMGWYEEPESNANARPMLVHCSAGCGRTGTFCTVDSVIDMLKRQRLAAMHRPDADGDVSMTESSPVRRRSAGPNGLKLRLEESRHGEIETGWLENADLDLVETTVEDFRRQRLSMVQSLRQFVLCYETVVEWVWRIQERNNRLAGGRGRPRSEILEVRR